MGKERKQICYPENIQATPFPINSVTTIGPLTFSKNNFGLLERKMRFQHHFPLQRLRLQNPPGQAVLWSTSCPEKKAMPAILSNPLPHHTPVQTTGQLNKQNNS